MKKVKAEDLYTLWRSLGIQRGMTVLCHSFLPGLGVRGQEAELVIDTLLDTIGPDGTFVVPSFSYSYFKGEVYDVEKTPSNVGALGDLVRERGDSIRCLDPNFSLAAIGGNNKELMQRDVPNSFGSGSIYDKLMQADVQVLLLGVDFTALALFMHLEKINNVNYRYEKKFHGITRYQGIENKDLAIHFVRDEKRNPISYRSRIGGLIDKDEDCHKINFGFRGHRFVSAKIIASLVKKKLLRDQFFLIKNPV